MERRDGEQARSGRNGGLIPLATSGTLYHCMLSLYLRMSNLEEAYYDSPGHDYREQL
jgi:hypothetical protein